jgi:hypothetical protein
MYAIRDKLDHLKSKNCINCTFISKTSDPKPDPERFSGIRIRPDPKVPNPDSQHCISTWRKRAIELLALNIQTPTESRLRFIK